MKDTQYFMIMAMLYWIISNQKDSMFFTVGSLFFFFCSVITSDIFQGFMKGLTGK
jgi:hypothetical protein